MASKMFGFIDETEKKVLDEKGYVLVLCPDHPHKKHRNYVYEHRLVMEKHLGRFLQTDEVVHHINGNKQDNRIENLQLFANDSEHHKFEWQNGAYPPPQGRKPVPKSTGKQRWRLDVDKKKALELYKQGYTYREIAPKIGITISQLSVWLKKAGKEKYARRF